MSSGAACVLDASALLAYIYGEPGKETVESLLDGAILSAVNWSEVLQKLYSRDTDVRNLMDALHALGLSIVPFDTMHADEAAMLWSRTRTHGLSLGDTACLALARVRNARAVTADRTWA